MAEDTLKNRLKDKLKEIFQFENDDLDFGIYKIINYKRDEIKKFIEKDLIEEIENELKLIKEEEVNSVKENIEQIKKKIKETFGENAIEDGKLKGEFKNTPLGEKYLNTEKQLEKIGVSEDLEKEIFNHLINFFSRYYDEGDFISQRRYGKKEKYIIPYNGEEVLLYWANKDQYYIKTTEYFKRYTFQVKDLTVNFRVVEAEEDKGDIKPQKKKFFVLNNKIFDFNEEKKELNIYFEYRGLTEEEENKYKQGNSVSQDKINEEIVNILKDKIREDNLKQLFEKEGEKTLIENHLYKYSRRNTMNYFIHKDLKGFLERELDFYIKNEFLRLEDLQVLGKEDYSDELRLNLMGVKVFRNIALKIIDFLAQIEDFQKKIWEKKKFVISTEYVITLDKIKKYAGEQFLESILTEILKNEKQLEEWKELFGTSIKDKRDLIAANTLDGNEWKKLPIDTRHFDEEFKWKLIVALTKNKDLDDILDGVLIKSENWQGLNTILNKYKDRIKTIYIDPPYNTGNDGFLYKDSYQHSSWLTMMDDRLRLAKDLLRNDGVIFVSIDDNEICNLYHLLGNVYFEVEKMKIKMRNPARQLTQKSVFQKSIEYCLVFSKSEKKPIKKKKVNYDFSEYKLKIIEKDKPFKTFIIGKYKIECFRPDQYEIIECSDVNDPYITKPISIRGKIKTAQFTGKFYEENLRQLFEKEKNYNCLYKVNGIGDDGFGFRYIKNPDERTINAVYYQGIPSKIREKLDNAKKEVSYFDFYDFEKDMNNESKIIRNMGLTSLQSIKPVNFIKFLISMVEENTSLILDFFAGSGTTAQAVMRLNKEDGGRRKFILVEMADYFDTIIIPRIKKVAYSFNWKDGKPQDIGGIGIFFKYHTLEQYEDSLENIEFEGQQKTLYDFPDYFVKYMLEWETKNSRTFLNIEEMKDPFNYKLKTTENRQQKIVNADLIETFNYLLGLNVSRYKVSNDNNRKYIFIFGNKENKRIVIVWRSIRDIDLEKDKEIIKETIKEFKPEEIYINGDSLIEGFRPIETLFKTLMFEKTE